MDAIRDPWVWTPLLGAAALQIDDWDRRTASWASEHTPVFGSRRGAAEWSEDLLDATAVAHYASMLATPSGDEPRGWLASKARGVLVSMAAIGGTRFVTDQISESLDRAEPDGGYAVAPSEHASTAAAHARLAVRNLRVMNISAASERSLGVGMHALAIGVSWSRVEAGQSELADVLIGLALGHFIAAFVNDAFLGVDAPIALSAADDGATLELHLSF